MYTFYGVSLRRFNWFASKPFFNDANFWIAAVSDTDGTVSRGFMDVGNQRKPWRLLAWDAQAGVVGLRHGGLLWPQLPPPERQCLCLCQASHSTTHATRVGRPGRAQSGDPMMDVTARIEHNLGYRLGTSHSVALPDLRACASIHALLTSLSPAH